MRDDLTPTIEAPELQETDLKETEIGQAPLPPRRPRRKAPWGRRIGLGLLGVSALAAGWGTFTPDGRAFFGLLGPGIKTVWQVKTNPDYLFTKVGDRHVNILLLGEDRNWTIKPVFNPRTGKYAPMNAVDEKTPPRSDTMIVVSLDKEKRTVRMLSLPRDARVRYTNADGQRRRGKLNAIYALGGLNPTERRNKLKSFLGAELGIRIDRVAVIDIEGFTSLIDQIGGVQVDVDGALMRDERTGKLYRGPMQREDHWGQWKVDLKPGRQILDGKQAQGYVRFRKDVEGDPGRIRRQQQVMRALAQGIMKQPILKLPALSGELRKQFRADMDDTEMASAAYFMRGLGSSVKIQPMTPYGIYAKNGDVILNKEDNEKLFTAIFGSSFSPNKFLFKSPSTSHDSIGRTNNRNPAALPVLREAGLVAKDEDTADEENAILDAPVRVSRAGR